MDNFSPQAMVHALIFRERLLRIYAVILCILIIYGIIVTKTPVRIVQITALPIQDRNRTEGWSQLHSQTYDEVGRTFAVFSTDSSDMQYASLATLSAYVWKCHLNVTPVVFIHTACHSKQDSIMRFLVDRIEEFGGRVELVVSRPGDRASTTMQNMRLVAFQHAMFRPEDTIITADADIWPLSPSFWQTVFQDRRDRMFIYNGPFYNAQRAVGSEDFVALSFLGAPVRHWRDIYRKWCVHYNQTAYEPGSIYQTLWQVLDTGLDHQSRERWWDEIISSKEGPQWSWDQIMAGTWLDTSHQCPDFCVINDKVERLDRSDWKWNEQADHDDHDAIRMFTDAHLPFPLSDEDVYQKLERVWKALFGSAAVISDVRNRILKLLKEVEAAN
jgi:hypothetical protein